MNVSYAFCTFDIHSTYVRLSFLKQRKNRRFNYTPRYYRGKQSANPYAFGSAFEQYRDTPNANDFGAQWRDARDMSRNRRNRNISPRLLVIIAVLLLLALYVLDFDLSIF